MPGELTQKDIEIAAAMLGDERGDGGKGAEGGDGEKAKAGGDEDKSGGADKGAEKDADRGTGRDGGDDTAKAKVDKSADRRSILDDLDDDDDEGAEEDKSKAKSEDKSADKDADKDKSSETAWRDDLASYLLRDQGDKLTAKQLETARSKIMKDLQRYKSAEAYAAAGYAAQQKIRSGEYKTARPDDDASEDDKAAWRKQNDIPEKWDQYDLPKVEGYTFVEADQPVVDSFKRAAHTAHLDRKQVSILTKAHAEAIKAENAKTEEQMAQQDRDDREQAADDLRNRYGVGEYKPRMKAMDRLLSDEELLPDERGNRIRSARYYDQESGQWRLLINDPYFASLLMQHAEYEFGDVGFTPTQDTVKSQGRIKELRDLRQKDYNAYMTPGADGKSPADELLALEEKEEQRQARRGGKRAA